MRRPHPLTITLLLLAIFGLWLFTLEWLHIRPDEHLVYQHTNGTLFEAVQYQATRDVQAPFWHTLFWNWRQLVGDGEFVGRYQGVLFSMLTASLIYLMANNIFGAARFGLFAMIGVAVNSYFITYAFEIRPYPLVMLWSVLSTWCLWRWLERPTRRRAILYGLSLALMAYTHYFMAFLVAAQLIYVLLQRPSRLMIRQLATAIGLALLVWLPWMPFFVGQVEALRQIDGTLGIGSTTTATSWDSISDLIRRVTNGLWGLMATILLIGVFTVRQREYSLLLLWAIGVPIIAFTANLFAHVYEPRYVSYVSVGAGVAIGITIAAIRWRWVRWSVMLIVAGLFLGQVPSNLPERLPYRTIFQQVSELSRPEDAVFFDRAGQNDDYVRWIMDQYLAAHLRENIVLAAYQAPPYRRIWHITHEFYDPHVQQPFYEVERTRPLTMVIGSCDSWCYFAQLLEGAPQSEPTPFFAPNLTPDTLSFYGAEVAQTSAEALTIKLWWMPNEAITQDYSMSIRLVEGATDILAQIDGPPTIGGNTVNTSALEPNRMVLDERMLQIPSDLPSGDYRVLLVVYHPIDGYILTTPAVDWLLLDTITVP
jgi:predicted tellurium resistance membrane protein TerC